MFSIILENLALKGNAESPDVFGTIYIQTGDFCFPYKDWTDFAGTVVNWWAHEFEKMHAQGLAQCELTFMDGDYAVVVVNGGQFAELRLMRGDHCESVLSGVRQSDIGCSIRKACDAVNRFLETARESPASPT